VFVLFPAACRRVDLSVAAAVRFAVWPGIWPALVVAGLLQIGKPYFSDRLIAVLGQAALGSVVYFVLFAIAIGRRDRSEYVAKALALMGRGTRLVPAS
jgi:predicted membrane protein